MCTPTEALRIMDEVVHTCNLLFPKQLQDAYLYGSYARGDQHEESDIDILLTVDINESELPSYRKTLARICSDLSLKHDIMISATVKPSEQFHRYATVLPYYQNVIREGIRYAG